MVQNTIPENLKIVRSHVGVLLYFVHTMIFLTQYTNLLVIDI